MTESIVGVPVNGSNIGDINHLMMRTYRSVANTQPNSRTDRYNLGSDAVCGAIGAIGMRALFIQELSQPYTQGFLTSKMLVDVPFLPRFDTMIDESKLDVSKPPCVQRFSYLSSRNAPWSVTHPYSANRRTILPNDFVRAMTRSVKDTNDSLFTDMNKFVDFEDNQITSSFRSLVGRQAIQSSGKRMYMVPLATDYLTGKPTASALYSIYLQNNKPRKLELAVSSRHDIMGGAALKCVVVQTELNGLTCPKLTKLSARLTTERLSPEKNIYAKELLRADVENTHDTLRYISIGANKIKDDVQFRI